MPKRRADTNFRSIAERVSRFDDVAADPIPHTPLVLRATVKALLDRIATSTDKKTALWCRMIVQSLAARERGTDGLSVVFRRYPEHVCNDEFRELSRGKPHAPGHIPNVVRLQHDDLKTFFERIFYLPISGLSKSLSVVERVEFHKKQIFEDLQFWKCFCRYPDSFADLHIDKTMREPEIRLKILAALHRVEVQTIESLLKPARPNTPPPTYLR
ncbi:hypothetical protein [Nitrospira sp. BLG_2]|uniref:hypothetical protein n=1 Tax=Nitrospira sp. BLG_2 TaxID=3397507 RepID=UPI003B9CF677